MFGKYLCITLTDFGFEMTITNNCTTPTPLIHVFARQGKSPSRIKTEDSIINRLNKIDIQLTKWRNQNNSVLGEEFYQRIMDGIFMIENTMLLFDDIQENPEQFEFVRA